MQHERARSREVTSELDSFLAGIDDYSKNQAKEEAKEKKAVVGAKTKDGKPAYYNISSVIEDEKVISTLLNNLTGKKTPMEVQADLFMKPIPAEAGTFRCILERDSTGWHKFYPKYTLRLEEGSV